MDISIKWAHHTNIRFYFIKDCIIRKKLNVKQCSTDFMLAYFPSKTLQGIKSNRFKNKLTGMNG